MDTKGVLDSRCDEMTDEQDLLAREIASMIADKWSSWIMAVLREKGTLRFSRIMDEVEGISQKMLTKSLRQLERHGLVIRTMFLEVPPRVEYSLSPLGEEMVEKIRPFWDWMLDRVPSFEAARDRFDAKISVDKASKIA